MAHTLFWISLIFVCYTYFVYPILVVCIGGIKRRVSHRSPGAERDGARLPSVTLIVIVYNEEESLDAKLRNCRLLDYPPELLTLCFVSDGSTDRTNEILAAQDDITFIGDGRNMGKPSRLNEALER